MKKISNKQIHYSSGIILSLFIGLHLFNHLCSIFGAEFHISMMDSLRIVYRNIVIESLLLFAVFVQIISGSKLILKLKKQHRLNFENLSVWSGFYLAIFLLIHVSAVLVGRFILKLDTNFYFGVAGINIFPLNLFFIPYYGLAIMAFFAHISAIHFKKMKHNILGFTPQKQAIVILIIGLVFSIVLFYGFTNHFKGVVIPSEFVDVLA
ncbi:hypothetical protein ACE193_03460 [Bernardetia sp. OM2101]|uniref:hypothetical protein n=1 Tax=Bernardetia sp. OM2101 TaxID=3344876 RepID=UPI0035CF4F7D